MFELQGKYGSAIVYAPNVDNQTLSILYQYLNHPISKGQKIRIMPDCHAGKGVVVGFTATLHKDWVIPNIVGVDIGCGVLTINVGNQLPPFDEIDEFIKENIPAGFDIHEDTKHLKFVDSDFIEKVKEVAKETQQDIDYVLCSLGTLGGGNHFIEIGQDDDGYYWLTIHTGSRNFGLKVANYHQKIAEQINKKELLNQKIQELKKQYSGKELGEKINQLKEEFKFPKELSFLYGEKAHNYLGHMNIAQQYASWNRYLIAQTIINQFKLPTFNRIQSVHNYIDFEDDIIRKGAIRAHRGELVVIPMNMAYGIVIGYGKGNENWNYSAPHGAGRRMSRREAKEKLSVDEFKRVMCESGVFSSTVCQSTLDEAPMAYKEPDEVLSVTKDTIEIVKVIKAVYNFKGM